MPNSWRVHLWDQMLVEGSVPCGRARARALLAYMQRISYRRYFSANLATRAAFALAAFALASFALAAFALAAFAS